MRTHFWVILRWFWLVLFLVAIFCFFYFRVYHYLNYATLKKYHIQLHYWAKHHTGLTTLSYIGIYILATILAFPFTIGLSLVGGYLFGPIATIYVVLSMTIGSTIFYLVIRSSMGRWLVKKGDRWLAKMENGFKMNAFNYLLVLRLIPIFPYWVINIIAGLLAIPPRTFILATLVGLIPGSLIYVMLGHSLNSLFKTNQAPNFNIIFTPPFLIPLLGLALLSLIPIFYKKWRKKN